jgi:hypothetical protein
MRHNDVVKRILEVDTKPVNPLRERFAKIAHDAWVGWMEYLFSKCTFNDDGSATIPKELVDWWKSEIETSYENLNEAQKESDRKEADKYLEQL